MRNDSVKARRWARARGILCFITLLSFGMHKPLSAADMVGPYDDELPLPAGQVLPQDFLEGTLWTVNSEAVPYQGLFQFVVETPWGSYPIQGEAMLRLRLSELRAIAELQEISGAEAAIEGAGRSLVKSAERLGYSVIHPVETAENFPRGARRLYRKLVRFGGKAARALGGGKKDKDNSAKKAKPGTSKSTGSTQKAAVWLARKYGGVGSKTRHRARQVGVDPYTNNDLLAVELERVSRAEAVGSVSTKVLLPVTLGALGLAADAANIAFTTDWREVFIRNAGLMREMGVSEELIIEFETHKFYTPMTQTLIISLLDSMAGAQDRTIVIEQAVLLESESEALFFLESVMLAEWYNREQTPLKAFVFNTLIPVAINESGNLVAFTAADYMFWTEEVAATSREFTDTYSEYLGGRELVMADYISPKATTGIGKLGWTVLPGLRQTYDVEVPWGTQDHE
jgi:hypothetical protein